MLYLRGPVYRAKCDINSRGVAFLWDWQLPQLPVPPVILSGPLNNRAKNLASGSHLRDQLRSIAAFLEQQFKLIRSIATNSSAKPCFETAVI